MHGPHQVAKKLVTYKVSLSFLARISEVSSGLNSICLKGTTASEISLDSGTVTESAGDISVFSEI